MAQQRASALVLDASMRNGGSNSDGSDDDENNNGGYHNGGDGKRHLYRGDLTRRERIADRVHICTCLRMYTYARATFIFKQPRLRPFFFCAYFARQELC